MDFLVFRLYGAMASWGETAVGQVRNTHYYPGKSAIDGLLAAALGIKREEDARHKVLSQSYAHAVKVLSAGHILKDYHTTQVPDAAGKQPYHTRRDELIVGRSRIGTSLSTREYLTDSQAVVALKLGSGGEFSLDELKNALFTPKFHLYLGRKAHPLAAPLAAETLSASGFREALDTYEVKTLLANAPPWSGDERWLPDDKFTRYYWEGDFADFAPEGDGFNHTEVQKLRSHDKVVSRSRWQFQSRDEFFWQCEQEAS
ncbi:MAG: type I-E CRISPR-associated protein Cas5/CasD [Alteromonadaceae bacterium]|nr:MAG: type I-E CRISPR-associated protein Cas5/CasD [Alteromonadaceae bacterium]